VIVRVDAIKVITELLPPKLEELPTDKVVEFWMVAMVSSVSDWELFPPKTTVPPPSMRKKIEVPLNGVILPSSDNVAPEAGKRTSFASPTKIGTEVEKLTFVLRTAVSRVILEGFPRAVVPFRVNVA
jgi:hypothetical protein